MTTKNKDLWVYLSDVGSGGNMWLGNLTTRERVKASRAQVLKQAEIGLRGYTLTFDSTSGKYTETGECIPMTEELWDDYVDSWSNSNGWIADWPHYQLESAVTQEQIDAIHAKLMAQTTGLPYEIEIIGLHRRFLMYFSDGDFNTQKFFDRAIPWPQKLPYARNGNLRPQYDRHWDHLMRDASAPKPAILQHFDLRPCLYAGPAWVVRVKVNGVVPLIQNCRMYVDDEGNFIASDWCQRQDYHSYGNGINLQLGVYTFASWLAGPCINYATTKAHVTIPNVAVKQVSIRKVINAAPVSVSFDDAMKQAKADQKGMKFPEARKDPGPITPAAMMEAFAFLPTALEKTGKLVKAKEADCTIESQVMTASLEEPSVLKDLIPDWTLVMNGSYVTPYAKKFPNLTMLTAVRKAKDLPQHVQYDVLYMYVRDWHALPAAERVRLVRDLRSSVMASSKLIPGVFVHKVTGAMSDTATGKVKPDELPFSKLELAHCMLQNAVEFATTSVPLAEVATA